MKTSIGNLKNPDRAAFASLALFLLSAGLVGPVVAASGGLAEPSTSASVDADEPAGGGFDVLFIAGSTFHPTDSATSFIYSNAGCIAKTAGSALFHHKVVLPAGALVKYMRIYSFDTSTSSITGFFTTYDAAGGFDQLSIVSSVNATGGYGSQLAPEMTYTVNQATSPINVAINMGTQNDSTLRFCGVRIAYYADGVTDRIFADGFD